MIAGHSCRCRGPNGGRNDGALLVGARNFQDDTGIADRLTNHIDHRIGYPADQPPDLDDPLSAAEGEGAGFIVQERGIRIDRGAVQVGEPKRIFGICHNLPFQRVAPFPDQPVVGAEQQKYANIGERLRDEFPGCGGLDLHSRSSDAAYGRRRNDCKRLKKADRRVDIRSATRIRPRRRAARSETIVPYSLATMLYEETAPARLE